MASSDGSSLIALTPEGWDIGQFRWSPEGSSLSFLVHDGREVGQDSLCAVDIDLYRNWATKMSGAGLAPVFAPVV